MVILWVIFISVFWYLHVVEPVGTIALCNQSECSHPWDSAPLKIETGVWPHLTIYRMF